MTKAHALFLDVASRLRDLARDDETTWSFGSHIGLNGLTHAEEEMAADGIDFADLVHVIRSCKVTDGELCVDEWRYKAEGKSTDSVPMVFIVTFSEEERRIEVITGWVVR